jgi:uncharacterized Zn-binding protein involved in type VI secretion
MAKLSRKGDANDAGGKLVTTASSVVVNGIEVAVHLSDITSHGGGPHAKSKTTEGSPTVFAEGKPVVRVGSGSTCGHKIVQGSPNVNVP